MTEPKGHVLYDGNCGICKKIAGRMKPVFENRGYVMAPLQEDWVAETVDLSDEDLMKDMHLLLKDGTLYSGAEVYRYMMRRIWWAYPIYLLSLIPGLRQLFNWTYRAFADNRYKFSSTCRLEPRPQSSGEEKVNS